ncbi:MAG: hypothetical protein KatS3mg104_0081 [Phycisphaerae bacterium]|nr:MAG: hypothetical protein KatS3mg104_0081 [Phycisphaerae bacterium]
MCHKIIEQDPLLSLLLDSKGKNIYLETYLRQILVKLATDIPCPVLTFPTGNYPHTRAQAQ